MIVIHAPNSDTENSSWPYNYEQPFSICAKYASVFDYFRQIIIRVEHAPTSVQRSKTRFINRDSESYRRMFGVGRVRFNASLGNADFSFFFVFFFFFIFQAVISTVNFEILIGRNRSKIWVIEKIKDTTLQRRNILLLFVHFFAIFETTIL